MMVCRKCERIERRDAEESQRIVDAVMLRHVLPADKQNQQHDDERPDAEHVVQEPREIDADESDIEPFKAAGRNDARGENRKAQEFIAAVGIRRGRRLAVPLPRCFFGNCLSCQSITSEKRLLYCAEYSSLYLTSSNARRISALRT